MTEAGSERVYVKTDEKEAPGQNQVIAEAIAKARHYWLEAYRQTVSLDEAS
jgi:hypothetical protein